MREADSVQVLFIIPKLLLTKILFHSYVNNIADNVASLVSATNNSAGFPGSVVLVQNSYGVR